MAVTHNYCVIMPISCYNGCNGENLGFLPPLLGWNNWTNYKLAQFFLWWAASLVFLFWNFTIRF